MIRNNKILRLLQKRSYRYTYNTAIYKFQYNAFTSPDLHKFQILKFVHKFIHHQDQLP